jgi:hypothetical protein
LSQKDWKVVGWLVVVVIEWKMDLAEIINFNPKMVFLNGCGGGFGSQMAMDGFEIMMDYDVKQPESQDCCAIKILIFVIRKKIK